MMSAVPYMPNITQIEWQICHGVVIWRTASRPPQQIRARRPCSSLGNKKAAGEGGLSVTVCGGCDYCAGFSSGFLGAAALIFGFQKPGSALIHSSEG